MVSGNTQHGPTPTLLLVFRKTLPSPCGSLHAFRCFLLAEDKSLQGSTVILKHGECSSANALTFCLVSR